MREERERRRRLRTELRRSAAAAAARELADGRNEPRREIKRMGRRELPLDERTAANEGGVRLVRRVRRRHVGGLGGLGGAGRRGGGGGSGGRIGGTQRLDGMSDCPGRQEEGWRAEGRGRAALPRPELPVLEPAHAEEVEALLRHRMGRARHAARVLPGLPRGERRGTEGGEEGGEGGGLVGEASAVEDLRERAALLHLLPEGGAERRALREERSGERAERGRVRRPANVRTAWPPPRLFDHPSDEVEEELARERVELVRLVLRAVPRRRKQRLAPAEAAERLGGRGEPRRVALDLRLGAALEDEDAAAEEEGGERGCCPRGRRLRRARRRRDERVGRVEEALGEDLVTRFERRRAMERLIGTCELFGLDGCEEGERPELRGATTALVRRGALGGAQRDALRRGEPPESERGGEVSFGRRAEQQRFECIKEGGNVVGVGGWEGKGGLLLQQWRRLH